MAAEYTSSSAPGRTLDSMTGEGANHASATAKLPLGRVGMAARAREPLHAMTPMLFLPTVSALVGSGLRNEATRFQSLATFITLEPKGLDCHDFNPEQYVKPRTDALNTQALTSAVALDSGCM